MIVNDSFIHLALFLLYIFCLTWTLMSFFFFFNDTATTEIYTLSLHDALPIYKIVEDVFVEHLRTSEVRILVVAPDRSKEGLPRSEEHTSELQSPDHLVCRLLLEKKKM